MLNMGIIGCGWAGRRHAKAILSPELRGRAQIVAICDPDRATLDETGAAWAVRSRYVDYQGLLERDDVNAVSICTPHDLHAEMTIAAAGAGKHVLVEKPIACTLAGADAMIEAAKKAGVVLMVAENVRYNPYYLSAKELIDAGYLGEVFFIRISRMEDGRAHVLSRPWFLDVKRAAGGIMMSGGIHDFEAIRMLIGEIKSVFAYQAKKTIHEMEGDDSSVALLELEDGSAGVLIQTFAANFLQSSNSVEVHGSLGSLQTDLYRTDLITLHSEKIDGLPGRSGVQMVVPEGDTFVAEMSHFADCVERGEVPITSGEEERKPLAAVLAAYESMTTGQKVQVPY